MRTDGASWPGSARAILRGLAKRCPRCGRGRLFSRWFRLPERCPACGLVFERAEGAFLGSITINYAVTAFAFVALLVIWLAVGLPDVEVLPLMVASALVVTIVPLVAYPTSKTLWAAMDYLAHRGEGSGGEDASAGRGGPR
jgi:uncharacterized protein (DUF983 family)